MVAEPSNSTQGEKIDDEDGLKFRDAEWWKYSGIRQIPKLHDKNRAYFHESIFDCQIAFRSENPALKVSILRALPGEYYTPSIERII